MIILKIYLILLILLHHIFKNKVLINLFYFLFRSAFFWFSNDERSKVKSENPEYGVGDIAKELGRRWAEADSDEKAKYVAMAEKDKARYEKVS